MWAVIWGAAARHTEMHKPGKTAHMLTSSSPAKRLGVWPGLQQQQQEGCGSSWLSAGDGFSGYAAHSVPPPPHSQLPPILG